MTYTKSQLSAINEQSKANKKIVVSASAGSGKTTVLTERLIQKILNSEDLSNKVIVTFTNIAADDMKDKIKSAIEEELEKNPNSEHLQMQLSILPACNISTIDSFFIKVLRQFFYKIAISPNFKIIDEKKDNLLQEKVMKEIFDKKYKETGFQQFVGNYMADFSDKNIKQTLINIYQKAFSIAEPLEWLANLEMPNSKQMLEESISKRYDEIKVLASFISPELVAFLEEERLGTATGSRPKIPKEYEYIKNIIDKFRKSIKKIREQVIDADVSAYIKEISGTLLLFHEAYLSEKKSQNSLNFNDIGFYMLELVKDAEILADLDFDEIYIDETQDINALQKEIFDRLAIDKCVYMVGDVKQSIYKFRNSSPELFEKEIKNPDNTSIRFLENFRSQQNIIDFVNLIFDNLIDNYEEQKLFCGLNSNENSNIELNIYENAGVDSNKQIQAKMVAKKILELKEEGVKYSDIAIILRAIQGNDELLLKEFEKAGIPAISYSKSGFFKAEEVNFLVNLLKAINNPYQDIPLLSILRSEIFGWTDDDIAMAKLNVNHKYFYDCIEDKTVIEGLIAKSLQLNLQDFLIYAINKLKIEEIYSRKYNSQVRQANINAFIKLASNFDGGIYEFVGYISKLIQDGKDFQLINTEGESMDAVTIITMHSSKGLQYPIVMLPFLDTKFDYRETYGKIIMTKNGIAMNYVDKKARIDKSTYAMETSKLNIKEEEIKEKSRLLYVALTRAENAVYIFNSVSSIEKERDKWETFRLLDANSKKVFLKHCSSYFDWLACQMYGEYDFNYNSELGKIRQKGKDFEIENIVYVNRLSNDKSLREKISISEYLDEIYSEQKIKKYEVDNNKSAAYKGTVLHFIMQNLDLSNNDYETQIENFVKNGMLKEEDAKLINIQKIYEFFDIDTGRRLLKAEKVNREYKFVVKTDLGKGDIIIQGVVDLWFEEEGEIVVVDFKTGNVNLHRERYDKQTEIYARALENKIGMPVKEQILVTF